MKKIKSPKIAELEEFRNAVEPFLWLFNRFGIAENIKRDSLNQFLKTLYQSYDADLEQLQRDITSYWWLFKRKTLERIMQEIDTKWKEHKMGMEVKNNIHDWMPRKAWIICMNEVVLPKTHKNYFEQGFGYLVHSLISRYPHWLKAEKLKLDYEKLHPNQSADMYIDELKEKSQQKEQAQKIEKEFEKQYAIYIQGRLHSTKKFNPREGIDEERKGPMAKKIFEEDRRTLREIDLETMRDLEQKAMYG
jgi:hypothetical protein